MAAADARVSARKRPAPVPARQSVPVCRRGRMGRVQSVEKSKTKRPHPSCYRMGPIFCLSVSAGRGAATLWRKGAAFLRKNLHTERFQAAAQPQNPERVAVSLCPFGKLLSRSPACAPAQEHSKRRKTTQLQRGETAQGRAIPRRPSPHGTAPARKNPAQASRGTRRSLCLPCRPGPVLATPAGGENPRGRLSGCGCR